MKITVIRPEELGASEVTTWHDLLRSRHELVNPFLAPEFAQAVGRCRDDVRVAVIEEPGRTAGFLAFQRDRLGIGRPVGAGLTDAQGAALAEGLELEPGALLKACGLSVWEFDHLVADQFPAFHTSRHPSPVIDLRKGLPSNKTVKTTMAKERKLERDIGAVRHDYATTDPEALRTLLGWKSRQYRRTGRTDRFAAPWIVRLVEELLLIDTPDFGGVLDLVYADDLPVAGHFGLRSDKVLTGWFPAYDPAFSRYSPGLIQHLAMAREAAAHGIALIDLGRGAKEYKDKLSNGSLTVAEGRLARATPAAALHWATTAPVRALRNTVLASPALRAPADRLLKTYGRLRNRT
ncbi:MAG: GNAT family N-acetyltransferase, partial [Thermoactinospora sp.]|nr:GNAT family N-acetyltransferase [Thermoactinospora sp.]